MSQTIRTVFFDFDGVLTTDATGTQTTLAFLARATGLGEAALRAAMSSHIGDLVLGRTTHAEIWPDVCASLGASIDSGLIAQAFDSTPLNRPMLELARALRGRCRVGMITDNASDRMAHLVRRHGLDAVFDPVIVSADVACSKRTPEIFRLALDATGDEAGQAVFIDNAEANLSLAAQMGMQVIHHDEAVNDVARVREILASRFGLACSLLPDQAGEGGGGGGLLPSG